MSDDTEPDALESAWTFRFLMMGTAVVALSTAYSAIDPAHTITSEQIVLWIVLPTALGLVVDLSEVQTRD